MDYGVRLGSLHYFWGGTWSPICYLDFNSIKYLLFCMISSYAVSWTGIPFEVARKAYFADLSWPENLRKGYRSPLHALVKIPFVEGPLYLFKGGFLTYLGNANFSTWCFFLYTWLKNKASFLWLYNDISYDLIKFINMNIAFAIGSCFGYPFYHLKNMIDYWPKERGGRCTFEGSGYNALKWLRLNYENYSTNLLDGWWRWFRTRGIIFYIAMWEADNLGLFTNNLSDPNTYDNIVAFDESD